MRYTSSMICSTLSVELKRYPKIQRDVRNSKRREIDREEKGRGGRGKGRGRGRRGKTFVCMVVCVYHQHNISLLHVLSRFLRKELTIEPISAHNKYFSLSPPLSLSQTYTLILFLSLPLSHPKHLLHRNLHGCFRPQLIDDFLSV